MSLGKLLTSGKSLIGLQNEEHRYQMRAKNLLPKFGSVKNPFSTAKPQALQPVAEEKMISAVARGMSAAEIAAAKLKETKKLPEITALKPAPPAATGPGITAQAAGRIARLLAKANPFARRTPAPPAQPRSAIPRFEAAPVQVELTLDRIKVVRNDLSEADVEVVPANISAAGRPAPAVKPAANAALPAELLKADC